MSMQYCHNCDKHIDTDYDAEHFDVCGKEEQEPGQGLKIAIYGTILIVAGITLWKLLC